MIDRLEIVRLTAESPHLPRIAAWQHAEWGHLTFGETSASRLSALREECGEAAGVPSAFVAMSGGQPVGTASLVAQDMDARPALSPWLASVFVLPEWRGRGIASRLVRRVEAEVAASGITRFYLFTPDQQALYRRLGWEDHEVLDYRGEAVTIMARLVDASA
ncbi:GNAT family N-acetyltransferase [Halomonas sp. LBP4]|uniref:GNAT family N-acetyltransferase n=1 Tax=Halomonas sp. LBP4 TaxID=2044917 RepID=UPI000D76D00E|nr:GNAT family N-acetyltransferase [Halomonas sp. LBP4]PXY00292.1 GNAT family N-acetyltransferase [Halomonas sp. LBP4]